MFSQFLSKFSKWLFCRFELHVSTLEGPFRGGPHRQVHMLPYISCNLNHSTLSQGQSVSTPVYWLKGRHLVHSVIALVLAMWTFYKICTEQFYFKVHYYPWRPKSLPLAPVMFCEVFIYPCDYLTWNKYPKTECWIPFSKIFICHRVPMYKKHEISLRPLWKSMKS